MCLLFVTKSVTVKLLPFDNKSEVAVVVDLPRGATLEDTERTLFSIADVARQLPEIRSIDTYAGTPAPFNFKPAGRAALRLRGRRCRGRQTRTT